MYRHWQNASYELHNRGNKLRLLWYFETGLILQTILRYCLALLIITKNIDIVDIEKLMLKLILFFDIEEFDTNHVIQVTTLMVFKT